MESSFWRGPEPICSSLEVPRGELMWHEIGLALTFDEFGMWLHLGLAKGLGFQFTDEGSFGKKNNTQTV